MSMKTAISIPDQVFSRADSFARGRKMTRSALFTIAVDEFIQHHRREDVTERLNEVYAKEDSSLDPVLDKLQTLSLPKEDW
jgi:metal-responsive CopG/Arc/MetJ family transcriptional regulator